MIKSIETREAVTKETVYEPGDDSYLLSVQVRKYSFGKVLDMGAGSGILGIAALSKKEVETVYFSDINPKALKLIKRNIPKDNKKHTVFRFSDLFSDINEKNFDTIIFNPPYLPEDEYDDERLITTGGEKGYETIDKFLTEAKYYLNDRGIILLLFSSLTDKKKIDGIIKDNGYQKELLAKKSLFMEQLYVYKIKKKNPGEEYKGHRGIVRTVFINGKKIAVKSRLSKAYNIAKEAKFLKLLNKKGIGPKLIKYDESAIYMQFIEGSRILDYVEESKITKNQIISVFRKILLQLYEMDRQKINKRELTHPYKHIIIGKDDEPFMIDFERCYYSEKSKNITQFIQFLCSARLKYLLDKKGIAVNRDNLIISAKEYKEKKDKDIVQKIINDIK